MTPIGIKERPPLEAHKNDMRVYLSDYYEAHKDDMKVYFSEYYEAHKDEMKVSFSEYYNAHKDEIKGYLESTILLICRR